MADKIIYLAEARNGAPAIPDRLESPSGSVADRLGRPLHDLRISITDRCNFRCVYCMPKDVFDKKYAEDRGDAPPSQGDGSSRGLHRRGFVWLGA